jgi:hypothetical protein
MQCPVFYMAALYHTKITLRMVSTTSALPHDDTRVSEAVYKYKPEDVGVEESIVNTPRITDHGSAV